MEFREKYKQYPYGEEEQDRILSLSAREYQEEINKEYIKFQRTPWIQEDDEIIQEERKKIEEKFEYFNNLRRQYPYGIKENDRVLQLSEEEFENEYKRILDNYEKYKDEALEFQEYNYEDVCNVKKKYKYFKELRNKMNVRENQEEKIVEK